ncbi:molybdopterin-dependent oxidoreductase [Cupriavidus basilensis]
MSTQFRISGAVMRPSSFELAALQAMPARLLGSAGNTTYTGVSLWDLINAADISVNRAVKNDILRGYVVATGSDGYHVVISLGEISPEFGNQPDLIAYRANGAPLTSNGFARLVVPNDIKGVALSRIWSA